MNSIKIPIPAINFNPPVYYCYRAEQTHVLDGKLDKPFWDAAPFTDDFLDIQGEHMERPRFLTRTKMLWDDENLYIGAILYGNEIWGNVTRRDDVIFQDNDFEIFIDPDSDTCQYYEFEMNVLNTIWDLFLTKAYRDGGKALNCYDIHGLRTAVFVDGSINHPCADNKSWSLEVVIPFSSITECLPKQRPPYEGEYYRMNFSRVHWNVDIKEDGMVQEADVTSPPLSQNQNLQTKAIYEKRRDPLTGQFLPEDNWVWAPTGVINIHYPELWGFVFFSGLAKEEASYEIPEDEYIKWELRKLYYAQQIISDLNGRYTSKLDELTDILKKYAPNDKNHTLKSLPYRIETTTHTFEISCPSSDGKRTIAIYSDGKVEVR